MAREWNASNPQNPHPVSDIAALCKDLQPLPKWFRPALWQSVSLPLESNSAFQFEFLIFYLLCIRSSCGHCANLSNSFQRLVGSSQNRGSERRSLSGPSNLEFKSWTTRFAGTGLGIRNSLALLSFLIRIRKLRFQFFSIPLFPSLPFSLLRYLLGILPCKKQIFCSKKFLPRITFWNANSCQRMCHTSCHKKQKEVKNRKSSAHNYQFVFNNIWL